MTLVGGAAAWPMTASAQQPSMPVIGYLDSRSPDVVASRLRAFRQGLKETGHVEARMLRSYIASRRIGLIDCQSWRLTWRAGRSR